MKRLSIAILIAILIILAFLPQILSTPLGKPIFEKALARTFNASVSISTLRLSWLGPQRLQQIAISNEEISGSIDVLESDVPLWSLSQFGRTFLLKNGSFSFLAYEGARISQVEAQIADRDIHATGIAAQGGHFSLNGQIYSKNDFDLVADLSGMPSPFLDQLLGAKGMLSSALGPSFNSSATAIYNQTEGKLKFDLSSSNAQIALEGRIAPNALLLTKPLTASLTLSPELSQALKARTSFTITDAKNPFLLRIAPEGTSIPLLPFSLDRLEVGNGTLDLGQVVCEKVPGIVSFLALLHSGPSASSQVPVWFTPLAFSISKGLLNAGRVDALIANSIHACAWGKVNLPASKLDLILGIPADTLENSLGIKGLSRNYVLKIPVRGSIQNPEFTTGPAAAKIAALLAGQQMTDKTGPFGGLFNRINPLASEGQDAPPANRPFPWEK